MLSFDGVSWSGFSCLTQHTVCKTHLTGLWSSWAVQSMVTSSLEPVLGGPGPVECGQPKGSGIVA